MPDPTNHKSVALDIETYETLRQLADDQCRTISGQIKWMLKNGGFPVASTPPKPKTRKVKKAFTRIMPWSGSSEILVRMYASQATLRAADFSDIPNFEDPHKQMYMLEDRGWVQRIGNNQPAWYQLTAEGQKRAIDILARRKEEGSNKNAS